MTKAHKSLFSRRLFWPSVGFTLPASATYFAFAIFPMLLAVMLSFMSWHVIGSPSWAGLANWLHFFSDPLAWHAVYLSIEVMVLSWVIQTPLSLLLGVYIAGGQKHRAFLSVFFFLPLLFSPVAIGLIWQPIFSLHGPLNMLLGWIWFSPVRIAWLSNPDLALYAVVIVIAWQFIPFHTLLYQAGTRQIPQTMYEAATLDGAGTLQKFFSITLPQLKYTFITSTILILTGSLIYFDIFYIMTGGGPGVATRVLPLAMYLTAFQKVQIGYGSVFAVVLAVMGIVLSLIMLKVTAFSRMESQAEGA